MKYLEAMWRHLNMDGKFDSLSWTTVNQVLDAPTQGGDTNNCGLYVSLFAERISISQSISSVCSNFFHNNCRGRWWIAYCLYQQKVVVV